MKKFLSILLAVIITVGCLCTAAFAQETKFNVLKADKTAQLVEGESFKVQVQVPGGEGEEKHDEIIVMIDGSWSVDDEWPLMREALLEIGKEFLDGTGKTQLTLMAFGMSPTVVAEHIESVADLAAITDTYQGNLLFGRSSTNIASAFEGINNYIAAHDETLRNVDVIMVTDGGINQNNNKTNWISLADKVGTSWANYAFTTELELHYFEDTVLSKELNEAFGDKVEELLVLYNEYAESNWSNTVLNKIYAVGNIKAENGKTLAQNYVSLAFNNIFEEYGLDKEAEYPIYVIEKAFETDRRATGEHIIDAFYGVAMEAKNITKAGYTENERCTLNACAETAKVVKNMFLMQYDNHKNSGWFNKVDIENVQHVTAGELSNVAGLISSVVAPIVTTPYNDVQITDYMSKWVNLQPETIKVVDGNGNTVAEFDAENSPKDENGNYTSYLYKWTDKALCAEKAPVILELVEEEDYVNGGQDVIGNESGLIYKITWNLKDGPLYRKDAFILEYMVTADEFEAGFEYGVDYPANGTTTVVYTDEKQENKETPVLVPNILVSQPEPVQVNISGTKYLDNKLAAGFEFALAENGDVISNAVSDEEGIFSFESLVLSKPGFYTYEVYEVAGEDESIEYDENVYTVMVEVIRNGRALEAQIYVTDEGQEAQIVFHNATVVYEIEDPDIPLAPGTEDDEELKGDYEEPEDPEVPMADAPVKEELPKTGDINVALFGAVAIFVFALGGMTLRKKITFNK